MCASGAAWARAGPGHRVSATAAGRVQTVLPSPRGKRLSKLVVTSRWPPRTLDRARRSRCICSGPTGLTESWATTDYLAGDRQQVQAAVHPGRNRSLRVAEGKRVQQPVPRWPWPFVCAGRFGLPCAPSSAVVTQGRIPENRRRTRGRLLPDLGQRLAPLSGAGGISHPVPHVALEHAVHSRLVALSRSLEITVRAMISPDQLSECQAPPVTRAPGLILREDLAPKV